MPRHLAMQQTRPDSGRHTSTSRLRVGRSYRYLMTSYQVNAFTNQITKFSDDWIQSINLFITQLKHLKLSKANRQVPSLLSTNKKSNIGNTQLNDSVPVIVSNQECVLWPLDGAVVRSRNPSLSSSY